MSSPFQLPTELADGLDLGSGLSDGYPSPCAPSSYAEEGGFSAGELRKELAFRLQGNIQYPILAVVKRESNDGPNCTYLTIQIASECRASGHAVEVVENTPSITPSEGPILCLTTSP